MSFPDEYHTRLRGLPNMVVSMLPRLAVWLILASAACSDAASSSADPPAPSGQRSQVAPVLVPASARLEDRYASSERWDLPASYSDAIAQQQALLPIGKPLDGYRWCRMQHLGDPAKPIDNTSWLWGDGRDAIVVSVFTALFPPRTPALIVPRHGACI
jgi:hypothetical protein